MKLDSSFFKDKRGRTAIAQKPNLPVCAMILFATLAILHQGRVGMIGKVGLVISLLIWSILEITSGRSPFRKTLGWLGAVIAGLLAVAFYLK